jgi:hypothetical protein
MSYRPFWERHLLIDNLEASTSTVLSSTLPTSLVLFRDMIEWKVLKLPPEPRVEALFLVCF